MALNPAAVVAPAPGNNVPAAGRVVSVLVARKTAPRRR